MGTEPFQPIGEADAPAVAAMMDAAFREDPISVWLYPEPADRARLHPAFFDWHVRAAVRDGHGWATHNLAAAMLWYDVPAGPSATEPVDELQERFLAQLDEFHADRVATFLKLTDAAHPRTQSHAYLPFIAVAGHRQGRGLGTALLRWRLSILDTAGVPAYLEASNLRNAELYARLSFRPCGEPIGLPDGPSLYPMWRPPMQAR